MPLATELGDADLALTSVGMGLLPTNHGPDAGDSADAPRFALTDSMWQQEVKNYKVIMVFWHIDDGGGFFSLPI